MIILGIDPGNIETGFLFLDSSENIRGFGKIPNSDMLHIIKKNAMLIDHVVIEAIAGYGVVGKSVFDTCIWIGRFIERIKTCCPQKTQLHAVYRKSVVAHVCDNAKGNDSAVRLAMIDRYEPGADCKKKPTGKLKGISKDVWSALALSTFMLDALNGKVNSKTWEVHFEAPKNDPESKN